MVKRPTRYSIAAISLHWLIAAALLFNFALGLWMHGAIDSKGQQGLAINAYQVHKSLGLTVLLLSVLRLLLRWWRPPPRLPSSLSRRERQLAKITHFLLYFLMIAIPLSGWLFVSAQWRHGAALNVPTLWFGLFEVPHLFGLNHFEPVIREQWAIASAGAHEWLSWAMVLLVAGHIAAALKHQFLDHDDVLSRMMPVISAAAGVKTRWRTAALVLAVLVMSAGLLLPVFGGAGGSKESERIILLPEGKWQLGDEARIQFAGNHANEPFVGEFKAWQASFELAGDDTGSWQISADIETGSARDGVALHDSTLPEREWFDVANYPLAHFRSVSITPRAGGGYRVDGTLNIKGVVLPVSDFSLQLEGEGFRFSGKTAIARDDVDLGMESDPGFEWVSRYIDIDVLVLARPVGHQH